MPSKSRVANMIKADLEQAGIAYVDEPGRYADFHSPRHTTGSFLAAAGVHPKVAQAILRHSKIDLTMSVYTPTLRGQESEAVAKMPDLSVPCVGSEQAKATGTDDMVVDAVQTDREKSTPKLTPELTPTVFSKTDQLSAGGTPAWAELQVQQGDNILSTRTLGTEKTHVATNDNLESERRRWDSNPRITVLQTVAFGRLATPPGSKHIAYIVFVAAWQQEFPDLAWLFAAKVLRGFSR